MSSHRRNLRTWNAHLADAHRERLRQLREHIKANPFRVVYRYRGDRPGMRYTHWSTTPRELVQFMRQQFNGSDGIIVCSIADASYDDGATS